jgi:hypothetical protein
MPRCTHGSGTTASHAHGRTLCFECFRAGMERTRARREAWAQRTLPFEESSAPKRLSKQAVAHRQRMLDYLASIVPAAAAPAASARQAVV